MIQSHIICILFVVSYIKLGHGQCSFFRMDCLGDDKTKLDELISNIKDLVINDVIVIHNLNDNKRDGSLNSIHDKNNRGNEIIDNSEEQRYKLGTIAEEFYDQVEGKSDSDISESSERINKSNYDDNMNNADSKDLKEKMKKFIIELLS